MFLLWLASTVALVFQVILVVLLGNTNLTSPEIFSIAALMTIFLFIALGRFGNMPLSSAVAVGLTAASAPLSLFFGWHVAKAIFDFGSPILDDWLLTGIAWGLIGIVGMAAGVSALASWCAYKGGAKEHQLLLLLCALPFGVGALVGGTALLLLPFCKTKQQTQKLVSSN